MQKSVAFSSKVQGTGASSGSWEDEASYTIMGRHQEPLLEIPMGGCGLNSTRVALGTEGCGVWTRAPSNLQGLCLGDWASLACPGRKRLQLLHC